MNKPNRLLLTAYGNSSVSKFEKAKLFLFIPRKMGCRPAGKKSCVIFANEKYTTQGKVQISEAVLCLPFFLVESSRK